jgi:hypothetical protein
MAWRKSTEEKEIGGVIESILRFPLGLDEFNSAYGLHEIIPLEGPACYVYVDWNQNWKLLNQLVDDGMVAVIGYRPKQFINAMVNTEGYGVPVKKSTRFWVGIKNNAGGETFDLPFFFGKKKAEVHPKRNNFSHLQDANGAPFPEGKEGSFLWCTLRLLSWLRKKAWLRTHVGTNVEPFSNLFSFSLKRFSFLKEKGLPTRFLSQSSELRTFSVMTDT